MKGERKAKRKAWSTLSSSTPKDEWRERTRAGENKPERV